MSPRKPQKLFSRRNILRALALAHVLLFVRVWLRCSPYICPPRVALDLDKNPLFVPASQMQNNQQHLPLPNSHSHDPLDEDDKVLVVASLLKDHTSWLYDHLPAWRKAVYAMDDPSANLTVPRNKGRESSAYLTYIIDNYDRLPSFMVFLHAKRYQWHNDDPMYDGIPPLNNLRLSYVEEHGYANMRCSWELGCTSFVQPHKLITKIEAILEPKNDRANTEAAFTQAFSELFPPYLMHMTVPQEIGVPAGAQFALSRHAIQRHPVEYYARIRDWLYSTSLPDSVSGRVLEYSWHMIMGKPPVWCPNAESCFCQKFGMCNLYCPNEGSCEGRYILPRGARIPEDWPDFGPGEEGYPDWGWWEQT